MSLETASCALAESLFASHPGKVLACSTTLRTDRHRDFSTPEHIPNSSPLHSSTPPLPLNPSSPVTANRGTSAAYCAPATVDTHRTRNMSPGARGAGSCRSGRSRRRRPLTFRMVRWRGRRRGRVLGRFFGGRGFGLRFARRRGPFFVDVGRDGGRKEGRNVMVMVVEVKVEVGFALR